MSYKINPSLFSCCVCSAPRSSDKCVWFRWSQAQHIGQSNNILTGPVEDRGKEMPKIVREYFSGSTPAYLHSCFISAQI